ncbi:cation:proton antiporter family protein [Synechococcus sp. BA-124 BA4]|jgi:Kef-type K+ transport system membrane component KefB|uniref:cation:proton antiporter n=1 Tax=Synechococcus sp. BA-124 BA4 TaxID=3110251 RepID=UPI002B1F6CD1|nr:cation:proton antiporter family protein [Synechococcus sp. BA-124 BA4]MEA5399385.1 cation:proton antiporter family protein [Synechococcus sp. BA-124 BA4]
MLTFGSTFQELAAILMIAGVIGVLALRLRQPLIIGYILTGIVVGPAVLGWASGGSELKLLSSIGISVLLFVVGLKLDVGLIRSVGPVALATGLGQIVFTSLIGFLLALGLGFAPVQAIYIAVCLTFSSTIIIVKLLSDKREIDSLHGRIAVGFLVVQDIAVILAMMLLSSFSAAGGSGGMAAQGIRLFLVGTAFVLGTAATMRWVMPPLLGRLAQNQELLVLFAVAWAVGLAALADGMNFSKEVGAFLGGVSIASTSYREAIASRLIGLRDFLLLFFFIDLGSGLNLTAAGVQLWPALVLSLFVLVGNPLIVVAIMGAMGYRRRTGLLAGLTVAQISEFSLILAALGMRLGQIGEAEVSLITLVGVITIGLSTYMILGSERLYQWLQQPLRLLERASPFSELAGGSSGPARVDVILLGLGRFGGAIHRQLQPHNLSLLGIDFDPQALRLAAAEGVPVQYGDSEDPEFTASLPLSSATVVVSTLPSLEANAAISHGLQTAGFRGHFIATAHNEAEVARLEFLGAQRTLLPFLDAAERAAELIVGDLLKLQAQRSV